MKQLYARRLLKLADFLTTLPKQKFNFAHIAHEYGKPMVEALKAGKTECGTSACAIGWLPVVFPRQTEWVRGLRDDAAVLDVGFKHRDKPGVSTDLNFAVAGALFGLDYETQHYLFNPESLTSLGEGLPDEATPKQVARRIRAFVKRKTKAAA